MNARYFGMTRVRSWRGVVHYAFPDGSVACNSVRFFLGRIRPTTQPATCKRCIGRFGP